MSAPRVGAAPLADLLTLDAAGMLTLRGREELVALRDDGVRRTAELLERHHSVIGALASLPFVRMLALSGGTAHKNARGGDDIDLFVVATAGRAYTAYTMLFLASTLTRRRGILCPNYLVDENHLRIAYHHDLFTAHQAISLVPIAGLDTFDAFVRANEAWVRAFYPAYLPRPPGATLTSSRLQRVAEARAALVAGRRDRAAAVDRVALSPRAARRQRAAPGPGAGSRDPEAAPVRPPPAGAGEVRRAVARAARALGRAGSAAMTRAVGPAAIVAAALAGAAVLRSGRRVAVRRSEAGAAAGRRRRSGLARLAARVGARRARSRGAVRCARRWPPSC